MENNLEKSMIVAGVEKIKDYGYPDVNEDNILTDVVYKAFFRVMLKDTKDMSQNDEVNKIILKLMNKTKPY